MQWHTTINIEVASEKVIYRGIASELLSLILQIFGTLCALVWFLKQIEFFSTGTSRWRQYKESFSRSNSFTDVWGIPCQVTRNTSTNVAFTRPKLEPINFSCTIANVTLPQIGHASSCQSLGTVPQTFIIQSQPLNIVRCNEVICLTTVTTAATNRQLAQVAKIPSQYRSNITNLCNPCMLSKTLPVSQHALLIYHNVTNTFPEVWVNFSQHCINFCISLAQPKDTVNNGISTL